MTPASSTTPSAVTLSDIPQHWITVPAATLGEHFFPPNTATTVAVPVKDARVGTDILCLPELNRCKRVSVESTPL